MKTLSEDQFQETVLRGVNAVEEKFQAVERNQETLLRNYDQLGRETKQTMEEMTRTSKHFPWNTRNVKTAARPTVLLLPRRPGSRRGGDSWRNGGRP